MLCPTEQIMPSTWRYWERLNVRYVTRSTPRIAVVTALHDGCGCRYRYLPRKNMSAHLAALPRRIDVCLIDAQHSCAALGLSAACHAMPRHASCTPRPPLAVRARVSADRAFVRARRCRHVQRPPEHLPHLDAVTGTSRRGATTWSSRRAAGTLSSTTSSTQTWSGCP